MNKPDQRDFDSHYEYWDKIKGVNGGEMSEYCCKKFRGEVQIRRIKRGHCIEDGKWRWFSTDGAIYYCPFCGQKL